MKQLVLTIVISLVFFLTIKAQGRDEYKNKGYFNLSKISFHFINNISEDIFVPNQGGSTSHLNTETHTLIV